METVGGIFSEPDLICPACGSESWKRTGQSKDYSVTGEWFELKECTGCHLIATYPQPTSQQLGRYYASSDYISHSDTRAGLINKLYHSVRNHMMNKKFMWVKKAANKSTGKLLDVGAGTGHFAKFMQDKGWDVVALEPDRKARQVAAEKLGLQVQDLQSLEHQQSGTFDVITLWHVLEHVHDLNGYLNRFRMILKPDGVLIIAVPNHTSKDARHYGAQWAAYDVPRHLWHFSPSSLEKLLSKHGFRLMQKITMPFDGFYVSMLSEKYRGNYFLGPLFAVVSGLRTLVASRNDVNKASSIIYVSK